jgi:hypothetical protein
MATKKNESMVKVRLPMLPGSKNQTEFFSVNGKNYKVKRGEYVDVPAVLAEVIENSALAEDAAIKYAESVRLNENKSEQ